MNQSPSILAAGIFTVFGAIIPLVGEAATATTSLDLFGRWVQAGGTVGMVGVLLWIRNEEKTRREREDDRRRAEEEAQLARFDRLMATNQSAFERLAEISEKFSLKVGTLEASLRSLAVEVRLLGIDKPDHARRVLAEKEGA